MAEVALKGLAIASKLIEDRIRQQVLFELKQSDVTGQHFRNFIINQLEEIKEKLDGLSRVDLLASLNFFKDGITLLNGYLETAANEDSTEKQNQEVESFSASLFKGLAVLELFTKLPGNSSTCASDQTDNTFFSEAKEKFDKSIEFAVKAVSNDALKLSDRIFAARLRVIGTILKHIDDTQISLTLCKSYVDQLNAIPEVQNNAQVHFGKGGAIIKKFYSEERNELVWSVISIHRMLWNYAHACHADTSYFTDWPLLTINDDNLHPILDGAVRGMYSWVLDDNDNKLSCPEGVAIATNGHFIIADTLNERLKVFSSGGHYLYSCKPPQPIPQDVSTNSTKQLSDESTVSVVTDHKNTKQSNFIPRCIAVDDSFSIFAGSSRGRRNDPPCPAEIFLFKCGGEFVKVFGGEVITPNSILTSIAIDSNNKRLLVTDDHENCIHTFSLNGDYLSRICEWEDQEDYSHIAVNQNGHILVTHWDHIRIHDSEGRFASKCSTRYGIPLGGIAFDGPRQQIYVLCKAYKHLDKNSMPHLQVFDKEWDFKGMIELPKSYRSSKGIAVTATGFVAVVNVDDNEVIVI